MFLGTVRDHEHPFFEEGVGHIGLFQGHQAFLPGDLGKFHDLGHKFERFGGLGEKGLHHHLERPENRTHGIHDKGHAYGSADDDTHRRNIDKGPQTPAQEHGRDDQSETGDNAQ